MVVQLDDMIRIRQALQAAGLDRWTVAEPQEAPFLLTVESSGRPGRVWLRPHFTTLPVQVEIGVDAAVAALERAAQVRLNAHEAVGIREPRRWACEDEALTSWDFLVSATIEIPADQMREVA